MKPDPRKPMLGELLDAQPLSTRRSLPMALLRAREAVMARFRPILARHDVTEQQWRVIRVLGEESPLDATTVAERSSILTPSLTRIIRTLELRGLIGRDRDAEDGRRLVLTITRKGESLIREVVPEANVIYGDIANAFGAKRLQALLDTLDDLASTKQKAGFSVAPGKSMRPPAAPPPILPISCPRPWLSRSAAATG